MVNGGLLVLFFDWSMFVSGFLIKFDQSFMCQFLMLIVGLSVLIVLLISFGWVIYNYELKEINLNVLQQVEVCIVLVGVVYVGDIGCVVMVVVEEVVIKVVVLQVVYGGIIDGKMIYDNFCYSCYIVGVVGVLKLGDKVVWVLCLVQGLDILVKYVIEGYKGLDGNMMLVKGGNFLLIDVQVKVVVIWIIDQVK